MEVGVGLVAGLAVGAGEPESVGVGEGVGVGPSEPFGVGEEVAEVVAVGVGRMDVGRSQTARPGLIWLELSSKAIEGAAKDGIVDPPTRYAVVPVGETYTTLAFSSFALAEVHGREQKIVGVLAAVSAPQVPENEFPLRSNRIVIGKLCPRSYAITTSFGWVKLTVRVSLSGSKVPSLF